MSVCLSEGLESALEIVNNLRDKTDLTSVQCRNYNMAMSLLTLSRRVFDIKRNLSDLEILKRWHGSDSEIVK